MPPDLLTLPFGARVLVHATVIRVAPDSNLPGRRLWQLPDPRDLTKARKVVGGPWPGVPVPGPEGDDGWELEPALRGRARLRRIPCAPTDGLALRTCERLEGDYGGYRTVRLLEVALPPAYPDLPARLVRVYPHPADLEVTGG